jgi:rod shape-determining protein MreC
MDYGPPPLFNQGVSARARLAFFSFLAIALIVVDSRLQVLETLRIGVGVVLYPLQQAMRAPGQVASRIGAYFTSIERLQRENESLQRQAVERAQQLLLTEHLSIENARLRKLLDVKEQKEVPTVLAEVLHESRDRFTRKVVVDKGHAEGLRPGQPVVDALGVVGQVTRVFPVTAEITLLTDKDQTIPVQIQRNGLRGIAYGGTEPGTLDLRFMASNADIVQGDVVVTSGLDKLYPPGLPVGSVARVERSLKDQFARVVLTPSAGVQSNRHLLVLAVDPAQAVVPVVDDADPKRNAGKRGGKR